MGLEALGGLASATPWGAVGSALSAAVSTPTSSGAQGAPSATGPKVINIAGFGSSSEGRASQSLTAAEPDRGQWFPSAGEAGAGLDVPPWVLPAVGVVLALAVVGALVRRK